MKTLLWQPVPALPLRYAIGSDSPAALSAARQLFAPWLLPDSPAPGANEAPPQQQWTIERESERAWSISAAGAAARYGELSSALAHIEYATLGHLVAHLPPAFIGLHGALLSRDIGAVGRRGVLIVGPKESGKSTLACALWRAGWQIHCDDFSVLDEAGRAHASARRVSLRAGSRALLGDLWQDAQATPSARAMAGAGAGGLAFHPHEMEDASPQLEPIELGALLFLNRRGASLRPAQAAKLDGIEAAFALLPYSTLLLDESGQRLTHQRADWGAGLAKLAARIESLPLYDLGRGELHAMTDEVARLLDD